jgi:hypothetical protein
MCYIGNGEILLGDIWIPRHSSLLGRKIRFSDSFFFR